MYVELHYKCGPWLPTGNVEPELPLNGCAAMHVIDVLMTGWVRRIWVPVLNGDPLELVDGTIGLAEALPVVWKDKPGGIRRAEIGSFISFCASPLALEVADSAFVLAKYAVLAAEKVLAAADETMLSNSCMNAAQAREEVAEFMKPNV